MPGIGEIDITGGAVATAKAVYRATRIWVRDLPITVDKQLL
jgi:CO/xanthine dehydrogenase Mo-binding subunit